MKKKLLIALMLIICLLSLFACGESFDFKALQGGPNLTDEVIGNGGVAVQKGDYIYMINGMANIIDDNDFGDAIRGAIYRLKVDNGKITESLIMAPKAFYHRDQGMGLFINGDKLYYTSPSNQKDKDGHRLISHYDVFSVNLNGTGTVRIGTFTDMTKSRFAVLNSVVCIVFERSEKIYMLKENGQVSECLQDYQQVVIGDDNCIYYTKEVKKEGQIEGIENFNKVYKMPFLGEEEEVELNGKNLAEDEYYVQLQKFENGVLYYSKNKKAGANPLNLFYAYRNGKEILLTASEVSNPYFLGFDGNKYLGTLFLKDSNLILIKASENEDEAENDKPYYITSINGMPTYLFTDGNELYFLLNQKLYKVEIFDGLNNPVKESVKIVQLLDKDVNIERFYPIKLGNYIYYIGSGDKAYYLDYLFRIDLKEPKNQEPERLGELSQEDKDLKIEDEKET